MMQFPPLGPVMPEIFMTGLALLVLILDMVVRRKETIALFSVASAAIVAFLVFGASGSTFGGMFLADAYSMFFKLIFLLSLVLSILISIRYLKIEKVNFGEYYAGDFIVLYLGLELMALSTYVLAGFLRHAVKSNEAAIKYFLLGAFASALLLYGISLVYGLTGTTDIRGVASYISANGLAGNPALTLSLLLFVAAFGFKIAAAPFHMWAPDVYEGAPTSITAFMSVGPKAAGFAVLARVFLISFQSLQPQWTMVLVPMAVLTMAVGNIAALAQTNIKRMLAYSSIAHAGYALLGLIAGGAAGVASMMSYLLIYAFMNIGAFAIIIMLRTEGFGGENISDYEGLAKQHPLASALMLIFMFSLTGIPPTAGFVGKFYLFMAAVNAGYVWLVVLAVIFSAISAFFYLRVVMYMYMREPRREVELAASPALGVALTLSTLGVLVIGVLPGRLLDFARLVVEMGWGG
jgi:NADH-quinone oxidoreductase subunit N